VQTITNDKLVIKTNKGRVGKQNSGVLLDRHHQESSIAFSSSDFSITAGHEESDGPDAAAGHQQKL